MLISAVHEENGREGLNLLMVDDRIPAGAKLYSEQDGPHGLSGPLHTMLPLF
ncbi:MAG: hypothetical protein ACLVHV_11555 [Oscillospiraceae bacterium]